ncbi:hypothetical protein ACJRO7_023047 [Eucalyptus globulus]|uniref:PGG domain-containing protein n=1 Tax=Eucalyptus globulus TaxID=34317 RepID=A0ABD3K1N1_EUCGL
MLNWRQLYLPHLWIFPRLFPRRNEQKASVLDSEQTYKQNCRTLLMVAALITTVTFVAAFIMPGGYNNNPSPGQGVAFLRSSRHLKWFIISNTIARFNSIPASSIILWGTAFDNTPYVHCYVTAAALTYIALQSTATSFMTGLGVVLPKQTYVHTMTYEVGIVCHVITCLLKVLV